MTAHPERFAGLNEQVILTTDPFESPQRKARQTPVGVCLAFGGGKGIRTLVRLRAN